MTLEVRTERNWTIVAINDRVDSFNFDDFTKSVSSIREAGKKQVAIDLSKAKFLSLLSIKYICSLAEDLRRDGGHLALLSASEKLKRQIHIYASLDEVRLAKSQAELR